MMANEKKGKKRKDSPLQLTVPTLPLTVLSLQPTVLTLSSADKSLVVMKKGKKHRVTEMITAVMHSLSGSRLLTWSAPRHGDLVCTPRLGVLMALAQHGGLAALIWHDDLVCMRTA